jgi:hypothetical protein
MEDEISHVVCGCSVWSGSREQNRLLRKGSSLWTASALRDVRGIGDYTAGAIASIAFNEVAHRLATALMNKCILLICQMMFVTFAVTIGCTSCWWKCGTSSQQALCYSREPKRILDCEAVLVRNTVLVERLITVNWAFVICCFSYILMQYVNDNVIFSNRITLTHVF